MKTAVDSSVLWCLLNREPGWELWGSLLRTAAGEGDLLICPVVFSEIAPAYPDLEEVLRDLDRLHLRFDPIAPPAAFLAGTLFKEYRLSGGPREHLIPDFLIGAHALHQADRLAADDRGYLRRYFPKLQLLTPQIA